VDSRIRALELRVRAAPGLGPDLRARAEEFARRVLERCDAILEEWAPGRVLLMRRLDMRWRLIEEGVRHPGEVEAFASEMAESLDVVARGASRAPGAEDVAAFADEAHWRACYLESLRSRAATPWYFEPLAAEGEPPGALTLPEKRDVARRVLERLQAAGTLMETLAALRPRGLAALGAALGVPPPPAVATTTGATPGRESDAAVAAEALVARLRALATGAAVTASPGDPRLDAPAARPVARRASGEAAGSAPEEAVEIEPTAFGGVFYLLRLALELGLGEMLWRACLPEGQVLAGVARAVLGAAAGDDAAARLFGGAPPEVPVILPEQHAEVAPALFAALVKALPRRRLAALPEPFLGVAETPAGPLLVAVPSGASFPLVAWPAPSREALAEGVAAFLAAWPHAAPAPRAEPALAGLDRTGRLQALRGRLPGCDPWPDGDAATVALVAQAAGTLGWLFAARAGAPSTTAGELVAGFLALPGRVVLGSDRMDVRLPAGRIDVDVRRAGLDADPGWVPWLERRVGFTYEECDPE
jgi:hypothetical protein